MTGLLRRLRAAAALVALVASCALPAAGDAPAPLKLRVATTPIDLGSEALYAHDLGFFAREGLDVDVTMLNSGSAVAAAVAGGSMDVGQANVVALASGHVNGLPFVAIAPAGYYSSRAPTTAMIVAAGSPIRTAKDLDGKTIAVVALKDITQVGAEAWIDKHGGDVKSVTFVESPQSAVCATLTAGRAQAGVVSEPYLSVALAGGCRLLADCHDAIAPQFLVGAWFATQSWAEAHPDAVRRFRDAIFDAARWANAHPAESAQILAKYGRLTLPPGMKRVVFADRFVPSEMQPLIDAAYRFGSIKTDFRAADLLPSAAHVDGT